MTCSKDHSLFRLPGRHAFSLAVLIALSASFSIWLSNPARAEITVSGGLNDDTIQVQITDGTIGETVDRIAAHFNITVVGEFDSEARITANLNGTLKQVMEKLFGSNNFMLVYASSKVEELVVLDGAFEVFSQISEPGVSTSTDIAIIRPPSSKPPSNKASLPQATNPSASDIAKLGPLQLSRFTPKKSRRARNNQTANQRTQKVQPQWDGKGVPPAPLVQSMQTSSAQNLMELVKALKALCRPDQSC